MLDMTQPNPAWRATSSMLYPRSFLNLTILPGGNVLATGGGTDRTGFDVTKGVLPAEMWSPATEQWSKWLGIDVTHLEPRGAKHCRLAVGRDYLDAAPVRGVRHGGGHEVMDVSVKATSSGDQ